MYNSVNNSELLNNSINLGNELIPSILIQQTTLIIIS